MIKYMKGEEDDTTCKGEKYIREGQADLDHWHWYLTGLPTEPDSDLPLRVTPPPCWGDSSAVVRTCCRHNTCRDSDALWCVLKEAVIQISGLTPFLDNDSVVEATPTAPTAASSDETVSYQRSRDILPHDGLVRQGL